jgi:hypothetical protein
LDNFNFQPNVTNQYENYYLAGLQSAIFAAQKKGYHIEYKIFKYSREPLAILNQVPEVIAWHPDAIIGPRNSNVFLTIQNSFKDILVLSPHASSDEVEKMPKNYYSLSFPDKIMAKAILLFLNKHYSDHGIYAIVEADCKNCVDISHEVHLAFKKSNPNKRYVEKLFLQNSVKEVNLESLLKDYQADDIIFLPNTSYVSAILMVRITNYINKPLFFMGGDDWGSFQHSVIGTLKSSSPYFGVRVSSWSLYAHYKYWNEFIKNYRALFHMDPINTESTLGYATLSSIIDALNQFGNPKIKNIRTRILSSYQKALKKDPNWYRDNEYQFFQNVNNKDFLIDTVTVSV